MKTRIHTSLATLTAALLLGSVPAQAFFTGAFSATTTTEFNDAASFFGSFNGNSYSISGAPPTTGYSQTDLTTGDLAQGGITVPFTIGDGYFFSFQNILLTQAVTSSGQATLRFLFSIDYQIGTAIPVQAAIAPVFNVFGTVQTGGFAAVNGFIDYYNPNMGAIGSVIASVFYNDLFSAPGPFTATVTPTAANTPLLGAGTSLLLIGDITFIVDPASINAESAPVPEPAAGLLALMSLPALLARRRGLRG